MKYLFLALLFIKTCIAAYSQDDKQRLLKEINAYKNIESPHLGGRESILFKKADTLNRLTSLSEKLVIVLDSGYVFKYYINKYIVYSDETMGFWLVKHFIKDTTEINIAVPCIGFETYKFNEYLVHEYSNFIVNKYLIGGGIKPGDDIHAYLYPKANKRLWKKKTNELKSLILESGQQHLLKFVITKKSFE